MKVKELDDVFRNTFGYKTSQKVLRQDSEQHPQVQINTYLAEFVQDHDDQNTLLIVYYAGHGKLGDRKGVLNLTGSTTINPDGNKEIHEIVWNSAESIIRQTRSDVLVVFDCCNAGEMERDVKASDFTRRAFEYISATPQRSTTRKPGPKSFTSALIWALKKDGTMQAWKTIHYNGTGSRKYIMPRTFPITKIQEVQREFILVAA
ncbi:hypothetical protein DID88_004672 [Monilinia fructigena]|uniref:Peptidase C14 caspase domain-containing protein n=1 Tax=Monilinia fructigena TaxID=38457 RepID=A0A395IRA6_9HELO|nr:hypothetical protein DID88_004672 [Monilinia fructigena]